jgi:hypothetical protein
MLARTFNKNNLDECVGTYKRDLRHLVKGQLAKDIEHGYFTTYDLKYGKNVGQVYRQMINMQDEEFKAELEVDLALRDMYTKPNIRLTAGLSKPKSESDDTITSKQRIRMLHKEGVITRAQHYKEDMQIFMYMQKKGLLLPTEENDPEAAVLRFREEIKIHPQTDLKQAQAAM